MNSKHRRTLSTIFADPLSATIAWHDIEALLIAAGCEVIEGAGSRVRFRREGATVFFHRPHPRKEAQRYQMRDARKFLLEIGVVP